MAEYDTDARYPRRFEIFRLEPLGDPAYYTEQEARDRYEQQRGLSIIARTDPPAWYIESAPKYIAEAADYARFTVTYYTADKTPVREVTWRRDGAGLFCRSILDAFYPEGDPRRRVRFADVVTVRQEISTDGVVLVTRESPIDDDLVLEVDGVPVEGCRSAVPAFGEWKALLDASKPADVQRFGWDAIEAADAFARRCASAGTIRDADRDDGGWRVDAAAQGVIAAIQAVLDGGAPRAGIPVLDRGPVRILPLLVQSDPRRSGRDPWEDRHRLEVFDDEIGQACEFSFGRQASPPHLDLARRGSDEIGMYAAALRHAGATRAVWWASESHGIVLVQSGDELTGDLRLAVQIVPVGWVSGRGSRRDGELIDVRWSRDDAVGAQRTSG